MKKKAAMQMSLGFIVAVVFAVILLSLAVMWLRGMMENIGGLTTDLTQQARNDLQKTFGGTSENFAVFPTNYGLESGHGVKLLGGIKNNANDGTDHIFVINVLPAAYSGCEDMSSCTIGGQPANDFIKTWLTWDRNPKPIKIRQTGEFWIEIKTTPNTPSGTYMFNVYACYDGTAEPGDQPPLYSECDSTVSTDKIWSTPKPLVITAK